MINEERNPQPLVINHLSSIISHYAQELHSDCHPQPL